MNTKNEFYIDTYDVVRWISSNNVPFEDMLQGFLQDHLITPTQYNKSNTQRQLDVSLTLKNLRKEMKNHSPSGEELFEMRAAFGKDTTVVNVITGKKVLL